MTNLDLIELKEVRGGAAKTVIAILAGVGVFFIGVLDGILRPLKTLKRK